MLEPHRLPFTDKVAERGYYSESNVVPCCSKVERVLLLEYSISVDNDFMPAKAIQHERNFHGMGKISMSSKCTMSQD